MKRCSQRWNSAKLPAIVATVCYWTVLCGSAWAQQSAPAAPAPTGNITPITRPLWTEIAITVVMAGLALFAVCRNSNRT